MNLRLLLLIALKDLRLIFRDKAALVLMLLAPFVLTLGLGALTGRFSGGNNSAISSIPVEIVNADHGVLAQALVEVFQSQELTDLITPTISSNLSASRALVDENQTAAVIFVPEGFSEGVFSTDSLGSAKISLYTNPTMSTSVGVIRGIVEQFINRVDVGRVTGEVTVTQLLSRGLLPLDQVRSFATQLGTESAARVGQSVITLETDIAEEEGLAFDVLAYMTPGMATMFLMFTVTYGARSLLVEQRQGTLQRMMVAPTQTANVLAGKFSGVFLTAIAQLAILIGGTSLLFRLQWGDWLGVVLLILAAAFGATGWGILFSALLKTPGQVAVTGSAVMLLFGLLGGSFFDISMLPGWIGILNRLTPNAWANDGFYILSVGGKLKDIQTNVMALLLMGLILFLTASFLIKKRGLGAK